MREHNLNFVRLRVNECSQVLDVIRAVVANRTRNVSHAKSQSCVAWQVQKLISLFGQFGCERIAREEFKTERTHRPYSILFASSSRTAVCPSRDCDTRSTSLCLGVSLQGFCRSLSALRGVRKTPTAFAGFREIYCSYLIAVPCQEFAFSSFCSL